MAAVKQQEVAALFHSFVELMHAELEMYKRENIPMAASDKAVYLQLFKHCNVTPEPDDPAVQQMRDAFSEDLEKRRAARAAMLTAGAQDADGLSQLLN